MKINAVALFFFISVSIFAQKQKEAALYTICGKPASGTMYFTPEEAKNCDIKLVPISADEKIVSFEMGLIINGSFAETEVQGNSSSILSMAFNGGSKILIQKVKITQGGKVVRAPSVTLQVK